MFKVQSYTGAKWYDYDYAETLVEAFEVAKDVRSINKRIVDDRGRVVADSLNVDYELREC